MKFLVHKKTVWEALLLKNGLRLMANFGSALNSYISVMVCPLFLKTTNSLYSTYFSSDWLKGKSS